MIHFLELASAFAQVGIMAFGGGLSTLPLIEYQLVTRNAWLTNEQFAQVLALSQVTPGPISINAATFVGYQQAGIRGSVTTTIALVAAPLFVLSLVLIALSGAPADASKKFKIFLRPIVAGLLSLAILPPLRVTWNNGISAILMLAFGIVLLTRCTLIKEHPALLFLLYGIAGAFILR